MQPVEISNIDYIVNIYYVGGMIPDINNKFMWPSCINNLSPAKDNLGKRLPDWIEQAFNFKAVFDKSEMFVPLFPISVFGTRKTSRFSDSNLFISKCEDDRGRSSFGWLIISCRLG
jgi:hypothetical protein